MPKDVLPPVELVEGPRKRVLTEKARAAAEEPSKRVKLRPVSVKTSSSSTLADPAPLPASVKTTTTTIDDPDSPPKRIPICPSDYTDDDYDWGTDRYSSPLPATSSPVPFETEDEANTIDADSEAEDVKPVESAEAELGK